MMLVMKIAIERNEDEMERNKERKRRKHKLGCYMHSSRLNSF